MSSKRTPRHDGTRTPRNPRAFTPVPTRARHDGWTPERQVDFIEALAECACVEEAARHVGLSSTSAYRLRHRADAGGFRQAWDAALDHAVDRLADAALGRAMRGVAQPAFYKGEQIGERRHYDERLTMFLLRYRRPEHYGAWMDRREARCDPEARALRFNRARDRVQDEAWADSLGTPRARATPLPRVVHLPADALDDARETGTERVSEEELARSLEEKLDRLDAERARSTPAAYPDVRADVAATSAPSALAWPPP